MPSGRGTEYTGTLLALPPIPTGFGATAAVLIHVDVHTYLPQGPAQRNQRERLSSETDTGLCHARPARNEEISGLTLRLQDDASTGPVLAEAPIPTRYGNVGYVCSSGRAVGSSSEHEEWRG